LTDYTKATNFTSKDSLSTGNPLKIVKGTEIDTEFNNIQTAVATKTDNATAAITGGSITGVTISSITDLAVTDGGTGASTASGARTNLGAAASGANSDITSITGLTTALAISQGGTGSATLTANNVLLGNGTSALQVVAPGTTGNVLTSNGTTWQSSTPASAPVTSVNGQTGAVVTTTFGGIGSIMITSAYQGSYALAGSTIAGSSLYYPTTVSQIASGSQLWSAGTNASNPNSVNTTYWSNLGNPTTVTRVGNTGSQPPSGSTNLSGTWRLMSSWVGASSSLYNGCCGNNYTYGSQFMGSYVRVS
jgi:hypothetical protein